MNRLLQGDVGSGKTMVALLTMLLAADNGFQSCLVAPTEILSNQHFANFPEMLTGFAGFGKTADRLRKIRSQKENSG